MEEEDRCTVDVGTFVVRGEGIVKGRNLEESRKLASMEKSAFL